MDQALLGELGRAYAVLNEMLFGGDLPESPAFVFRPRKKVALRFSQENVHFVVGSDFKNLDQQEILAVLLHEMVHFSNFREQKVDCTANQYHNKQFLVKALAVGLVVIKHKSQGWAITTTAYPRNVVNPDSVRVSEAETIKLRIKAFAAAALNKDILKVARTEIGEWVKQQRPVKFYLIKYTCNCPPPHNSIRSGRRPGGPNALAIMCLRCNSLFVPHQEDDIVE